MQDAVQIIEVLLPDRDIGVHTELHTDGIDLRTRYLLCLELRDIRFSRIARHQAWNDEIERYRSPQCYQVEARTPQEKAHCSLSAFLNVIKGTHIVNCGENIRTPRTIGYVWP